jgi:hypothetical protein
MMTTTKCGKESLLGIHDSFQAFYEKGVHEANLSEGLFCLGAKLPSLENDDTRYAMHGM